MKNKSEENEIATSVIVVLAILVNSVQPWLINSYLGELSGVLGIPTENGFLVALLYSEGMIAKWMVCRCRPILIKNKKQTSKQYIIVDFFILNDLLIEWKGFKLS